MIFVKASDNGADLEQQEAVAGELDCPLCDAPGCFKGANRSTRAGFDELSPHQLAGVCRILQS